MRRSLLIGVGCLALAWAGGSAAKPVAPAWLQTRAGAEDGLVKRFKNIETATCVPDSNSTSSDIGTVLYWHQFWCAGRTYGGAAYHLLFDTAGKCDQCWTIDDVSGVDVSALPMRQFAAPAPESRAALASGDRPERLFQAVASGMLYLSSSCKTGEWSGSGFLVGPETLVTALHVVNAGGSPCARVTAKQQGTNRVDRVTGWDSYPAEDVAVAHLASPLSGFFFSIAPTRPDIGASVISLAYALGNPLSLNQGTVTQLGQRDGVPGIHLDLLDAGGASGGPILDAAGQVVGLVQRGYVSIDQSDQYTVNLTRVAAGSTGLCGALARTSANTLCRTAAPGLLPPIPVSPKPAPTVRWPPKGYTRMSNSIYYKWASGSCTGAQSDKGCWQISIVDRFACPAGVVVIINEQSTKYVLGSVIAGLSSLRALTPAQLEVDADQTTANGALDGVTCLWGPQPYL